MRIKPESIRGRLRRMVIEQWAVNSGQWAVCNIGI